MEYSGSCVIVTNAQSHWVEECLRRFAPELISLFACPGGPSVLYAKDCQHSTAMTMLAFWSLICGKPYECYTYIYMYTVVYHVPEIYLEMTLAVVHACIFNVMCNIFKLMWAVHGLFLNRASGSRVGLQACGYKEA